MLFGAPAPTWIRLVLCGFVAGVVWNLLSTIFLSVFAPDFLASLQSGAPHPPRGGAFFFAVDVVMGFCPFLAFGGDPERSEARPLPQVATADLIASLRPGQSWALKTRPDGTVLEGHHRLVVLRERGIDIDTLPREVPRQEPEI